MSKHNRLIAFALTFGMLAGAYAAPMTAIKVNGETIPAATQEALIAKLVKQGMTRSEQLEERVRYVLTRDTVLAQQARRQKIDKRKDVQKEIHENTNQILIRALLSDYVKKNPVKEPEVRALYDRQKANWGPTEVKLRHILVKDEALAKKLLEQVKKGDDFEKLAKQHSIDTEQNKNAGGLIDWTSPVLLGTEIGSALSALNPGQVAATPVKSRFGWHVLKLEDRRDAQRWKSYEDNKAALTDLLTNKQIQTYVQNQIKQAKVVLVPAKAP